MAIEECIGLNALVRLFDISVGIVDCPNSHTLSLADLQANPNAILQGER